MRLLLVAVILSFQISCDIQNDSDKFEQEIKVVESPIIGNWTLKEFDRTKFDDSLKVVYSFMKFGLVEIETSAEENEEILEFEIKDSILFIGTSEYLVAKLTDDELEFIGKKYSTNYYFKKLD